MQNKTGRPPFFETPDDLEIKIDEYFVSCENNKKPCTVAGLAHFLGFVSKQSLYDYEKKEGFSYLITRAKLAIEAFAEGQLYSREGSRGAEFVLSRCYGWVDPLRVREIEIKEREVAVKEAQAEKFAGINPEMIVPFFEGIANVFKETAPERRLEDFE